jgi:NADH-quinone oxidoreductase subunit J
MSFSAAAALYHYMAAASVASAMLAVTRRNPVQSMLWVLSLFLHVAGIFLFLGAEFLAAVQTIVYAGAILVFYLFVLMLLDLPGEEAQPRFGAHWPLAAVGGLGFMVLTWWVVGAARSSLDIDRAGGSDAMALADGAEGSGSGNLAQIGRALFGPCALPFELAGLVLLAAIVGAVVLARRRVEP